MKDPHAIAAACVRQALANLAAAKIEGITLASATEIDNLIATAESVIAILEEGARLRTRQQEQLNGFGEF